MLILAINPGATSTKLAIYNDENKLWKKNIQHTAAKLKKFDKIIEQLMWRQKLIKRAIKKANFEIKNIEAIVARGGAGLEPVAGGTYKIDNKMINDLRNGKNGEHASNLAGIIAYNMAKNREIPAFIVDPVSIDEFEKVARLSGLPEIPRRSQLHALNLKAIARKTAGELKKVIEDINLIGVHLGGGISIAAIKKGRIIDVNNANQNGPYSPDRVGTLPVLDLVDYIYDNDLSKQELKKMLVGRGGLLAYLGTNDARKIENRISNGDKKAELVYKGMIYQIAKEIGAMATVLTGNIQGIFITGGLAKSEYIIKKIKERVKWIAPVFVYPGSQEIEHLIAGAYRVLKGAEEAKSYSQKKMDMEDLL